MTAEPGQPRVWRTRGRPAPARARLEYERGRSASSESLSDAWIDVGLYPQIASLATFRAPAGLLQGESKPIRHRQLNAVYGPIFRLQMKLIPRYHFFRSPLL